MPRNTVRRRVTVAALTLSLICAAFPPFAVKLAGAQQQGCPLISGFVYYDVNANGIKDAAEPGISGNTVELRAPNGTVVATTTTGASGSYSFQHDPDPGAATRTITRTANFPSTVTDWSATRPILQFDPALGTLKSVDITIAGQVVSSIKTESLDREPQTVTGEVGGTITVELPGKTLQAKPLAKAGTFDAAPYDGTSDFAGLSGHDFGTTAVSDSATGKITAAVLAQYVGTGNVDASATVAALSRTTGGGNVLNEIRTTASADVTVVYTYVPVTCLDGGNYNICQPHQPTGYSDGQETAGNITPIPGSMGTDCIAISLTDKDLPNNNFGELKASLHGCVYVDANDDGVRDPGEAPIPGVIITLTGSVQSTTTTGADGCYLFSGLPGGRYIITETQPPAFRDCKDSIGTQGGKTENDRHYDIDLSPGVAGRDNNFGECLANPQATSTVAGSTPTSVTSGQNPPPQSTIAGGPPLLGTPTVQAPSAGTGVLDSIGDAKLIVVGLMIFAASGWLAFMALRRRTDNEEVR
jgi:hypothetical protein